MGRIRPRVFVALLLSLLPPLVEAQEITRLPHPSEFSAELITSLDPRQPSQRGEAQAAEAAKTEQATTESSCAGSDATFESITVCENVSMAGDFHRRLVFAGADQKIRSTNTLSGEYAGGKTELFFFWDDIAQTYGYTGWYFAVPDALTAVNTDYLLGMGSAGLFLALGRGGFLMLGESSGALANQGCTMFALDTLSEEPAEVFAGLHLETDPEGTSRAQIGVVCEPEAGCDGATAGMTVSKMTEAPAEVKVENGSGAGILIDADGNVVVQLGPEP